MNTNILVDLYTPEKVLFENVPVDSLLIPTSRGQINVLPAHTHLITRLSTGEMTLFGGPDDGDRHFLLTYGICKIINNKVVIMSHTAEELFEIDVKRAEKSLKNATEKLSSIESLSDLDISKYQRKVERSKLRIELANKYK